MKYILLWICSLYSCLAMAQPAWQQRVDTRIEVTLDDRKHILNAYEEMTYANMSPDTLRFLYIHLWPNAYKNDHTPFERQQNVRHRPAFYFSKPNEKGHIDSLQFSIGGHIVDYTSSDVAPDIARIDLPEPLLPGKTVKITTPFRVKIPNVFSRMGHVKQAYFLTQWYPKPAVYDQLGWHPMSYLDQGEFYSEYGSYDVQITLPANYVVMATGNCLDEKENQWMDGLARKPLDSTRLNNRQKDVADSAVKSAKQTKTLHYHEDHVHDFAWFADKRWIVRKDTTVSPGSGEPVTLWTAILPSDQREWAQSNDYLKETINHYGKWVGPYAYKTMKVVEGDLPVGSGMEYPTVTLIDKSTTKALRTIVTHEAGHNWFYGMLGSNERDHAWMDEGMNTFYEEKTSRDLKGDTTLHQKPAFNEAMALYERAAVHKDQAIGQTSENFDRVNYGTDVYYKTTLSLQWLEAYMGRDNFAAAMHDYYARWLFHHPYPADFRTCLERHTDKPLGWFFDTLLQNSKRIDYTILSAHKSGGQTEVRVRNNTGVYAPVCVDAMRKDAITGRAWSQPFTGVTTLHLDGDNWNKLRIDDAVADERTNNNVYATNCLFHRFGLGLRPLAGVNMHDNNRVYIAPALGWNETDGVMGGIVLHNLTLPENRFRFIVAPMYSGATNSLVGAGSIGCTWYPGNMFREIMAQVDGKSFHSGELFQVPTSDHVYAGYTKLAPSVNIYFRHPDFLASKSDVLTLKAYFISEDYRDSLPAPGMASYEGVKAQQQYSYGRISYRHANNRTYNPFGYVLDGHMSSDFIKLTAEAHLDINYNQLGKFLYVRGFIGKFIALNNTSYVINRYELNATCSGINDYLYDGTYPGRSATNSFFSQQVSGEEGGFKVPVFNNAARSDNFMATLNLATTLPGKLPVLLFADAGLVPNAAPSITNSGSTTLLYDGGVEIRLLRGICSIYIPIIMSSDFSNYLDNTWGKSKAFMHSLSFTMQLQHTNWLRAPGTVFRQGTSGGD